MLFLHIGEGFCLQPFPPNDSVSSLFVYFSGSVVDTKVKIFGIYVYRLL